MISSRQSSVVKRRRVELACTNCRRKKSKCDGRRPSCSFCQQGRLLCQYEETSRNANDTRPNASSKTPDLVHKVAQLEQDLAVARGALPLSPSSIPEPRTMSQLGSNSRGGFQRPSSRQYRRSDTRDGLLDVSDEEATVDALATTTFSHEPEIGIGHFGPSSNHGYFRAISNIFAHLPDDGSAANPKTLYHWHQEHSDTGNKRQASKLSKPTVDPAALPDDQTATSMLIQFFSTTLLLTPYLSKSKILRQHSHSLTEQHAHLGRIRRALFNIIWAHGAYSASSDSAELFYRRAICLMDSLTIRDASEEMVQLLLLICHFQQNNQRSVTSWTFHALCVKTAFQIGLHYPATYDGLSADNQLLRKQLWFGVLNHDRMLATALGRPCLIPRQHARIHLDTSNEGFDTSINNMNPIHSKAVAFMSQVTTLYDIFATVVEQLYDHNITSTPPAPEELLVRRLQLYLRLEKWRESLHQTWAVLSAAEARQKTWNELDAVWPRVLLSIHYYRCQLLLSQPIILIALRSWVLGLEPLSKHIHTSVLPVIISDFAASLELVGLIQSVSDPNNTFLRRHGAWFLANYSVFTANVHLFAHALACAKQASVLAEHGMYIANVEETLRQGLNVLVTIGKTSLMSQKGAACLFSLLDVLLSFVKADATALSAEDDGAADHSTTHISGSAPAMAMGSLADFITQATDDFFFGAVGGDPPYDQYFNL